MDTNSAYAWCVFQANRLPLLLVLSMLGCAGLLAGRWVRPGVVGAEAKAADPNAACASCHRAIYERYRKTPMANASGPAADGFIPADFFHRASGVRYRIYEDGGKVWLSFERPSQVAKSNPEARGNVTTPTQRADPSLPSGAMNGAQPGDPGLPSLSGRRELLYFLGRGCAGAPIYSRKTGTGLKRPSTGTRRRKFGTWRRRIKMCGRCR